MSARRRRFVDFSLQLEVDDARELIRAARDRAEQEGCRRGNVRNVVDAVRWLLDPGTLAGCSIQDSQAEEFVHR